MLCVVSRGIFRRCTLLPSKTFLTPYPHLATTSSVAPPRRFLLGPPQLHKLTQAATGGHFDAQIDPSTRGRSVGGHEAIFPRGAETETLLRSGEPGATRGITSTERISSPYSPTIDS